MTAKNITGLLFFSVLTGISCKHEAAAPNGLYFPQVKAIVETNCVSCHYPEGPGRPVDLTTDENISALAASIKAATTDPASPQNRRMPEGGELSQTDKDIIIAWYNKGGKTTD